MNGAGALPDPGFARGNALLASGRPQEALEEYDRALARHPGDLGLWQNRAHAMRELGRWDEAVLSLDAAIALSPGSHELRVNRALYRLALGDLRGGWEDYESRLHARAGSGVAHRAAPEWDGGFVDGTLLVLAEQGLGEQVFFGGMLEELRPRARSIALCVDHRLVPLYRRAFPDFEVLPIGPPEALPRAAAQLRMGSLGRHFRASPESLRAVRTGYLRADATRAEALREGLSAPGQVVCGVSWASRSGGHGAAKSLALAELAPLLAVPSLRFVDLQYGDTAAEQEALLRKHGLGLQRVAEIDNREDLDGLAALIEACDLVVTASNATAHLAAALGKETWVLLPRAGGLLWHWHLGAERTPWYPSARLFRASASGGWDEAVARVRDALVARSG